MGGTIAQRSKQGRNQARPRRKIRRTYNSQVKGLRVALGEQRVQALRRRAQALLHLHRACTVWLGPGIPCRTTMHALTQLLAMPAVYQTAP